MDPKPTSTSEPIEIHPIQGKEKEKFLAPSTINGIVPDTRNIRP